jgi:hypothetical protein
MNKTRFGPSALHDEEVKEQVLITTYMPFCRQCGKEVQADWATCPYCSQTIGAPATQHLNVKDSVVSGDVNITQNIGEKQTKCQSCEALDPERELSCVGGNDGGCNYHGCDECVYWVWPEAKILRELKLKRRNQGKLGRLRERRVHLNYSRQAALFESIADLSGSGLDEMSRLEDQMSSIDDDITYLRDAVEYAGGDADDPHKVKWTMIDPNFQDHQKSAGGPFCNSCVEDGVKKILDSLNN